jgi:hypothetical protein
MEPEHAATNELRGMILLGLTNTTMLKSLTKRRLVPKNPLPMSIGASFTAKGDFEGH